MSNNNSGSWTTQAMDIAFVQDITGSQQPYISAVKQQIHKTVDQLRKQTNDIRLALVTFRDYTGWGGDNYGGIQTHQFTRNVNEFYNWLVPEQANGGDDGPESQLAALNASLVQLNWRSAESTRGLLKAVFLLTDSPPHGISDPSIHDNYPRGEPQFANLRDPYKLGNMFAHEGIRVYLLLCEPELSKYPRAYSFYVSLVLAANKISVDGLKKYVHEVNLSPKAKTSAGVYPMTKASADMAADYVHHAMKISAETEALAHEHRDRILRLARNSHPEAITEELHPELVANGVTLSHLEHDHVYDHCDNFVSELDIWGNSDDADHARQRLASLPAKEYLRAPYRNGDVELKRSHGTSPIEKHQTHQIVQLVMARNQSALGPTAEEVAEIDVWGDD